MKIKYLWQYRHYKPEYDIEDMRRVNDMGDTDPCKIIKLMKALYPLRVNENRPDLCEEFLDSNDMKKWQTKA